MSAATTSTSPKRRAKYRLRLIDRTEAGLVCDFALRGSVDEARFELAREGVVNESHRYDVALLADEPLDASVALFSVNGEEPCRMLVGDALSLDAEGDGGEASEGRLCYRLEPADGGDRFFQMAYGFAVVEVVVCLADGSRLVLATNDIACFCNNRDQEIPIARMLDELASSGHRDAIGWMLAPEQAACEGLVASDAGGFVDGSRSSAAFLQLCEEVLRVYETNVSLFRSRPHSKVLKREELVGGSSVRRFGRSELLWLSRTPESLYKTKRETAIVVDGVSYMASRVQTERSFRSFDTPENRAVLAFLDVVGRALGAVADEMQRQVAELDGVAEELRSVDSGQRGLLPALVVVEACLRSERPFAERARALRRKARRLRHALADAFGPVSAVRYRLPRRSKVFQEVRPYADVHACMRRWDDFGEFLMLRDGLTLQTWRMDKLYEYYVLYRLLDTLSAHGFSLDESCSEPARRVGYSLQSRYYSNEAQVANVYRLVRGGERVTLFYEPVVYGDEREENGIDLHRTTRTESGHDSFWTPDYLIRHEANGQVRRIVLDAKFRRLDAVQSDGSGDSRSCFEQCLIKYKAAMMGVDGRRIDSLWLLCGRALGREVRPYQVSSWAAAQDSLVPDGIATVAPEADGLADVLTLVGLGPLESAREG